jgi:hypothetical protein
VVEGRLGHPEVAVDVGLERAVPLLGGDVGDGLGGVLEGDVVDEDVEPAELLHRALDHPTAVLLVGDLGALGEESG